MRNGFRDWLRRVSEGQLTDGSLRVARDPLGTMLADYRPDVRFADTQAREASLGLAIST